jgi:hypothetical protein
MFSADCRIRSRVGRVSSPAGVSIFRPLLQPEEIFTTPPPRWQSISAEVTNFYYREHLQFALEISPICHMSKIQNKASFLRLIN